jgi:hypothetical protein
MLIRRTSTRRPSAAAACSAHLLGGEHLWPGEVVHPTADDRVQQGRRRDLRDVTEVDVRERRVGGVGHGDHPGPGLVEQVLVVRSGPQDREPVAERAAQHPLGLALAQVVRHAGVVGMEHRVEHHPGSPRCSSCVGQAKAIPTSSGCTFGARW